MIETGRTLKKFHQKSHLCPKFLNVQLARRWPRITRKQRFIYRKYARRVIQMYTDNMKSESALLPGLVSSYLVIFLTNFWFYHFFHNFWDFRKPDSILNQVFTALDIPNMSRNDSEQFPETSFFHNFLSKFSLSDVSQRSMLSPGWKQ